MPRGQKKKRRRGRQQPNGFEILDSLIDRGVRSVVDAVGQRFEHMASFEEVPQEGELKEAFPCSACATPTGRVCFMCRKAFCPTHTEFHNDDGWAICTRCIDFMVSSAQMRIRAIAAKNQKRTRGRPAPGPPPAPSGPTPWEVLGVTAHADHAQIRKAYARLCMETHPDRHPNDPEKLARYKLINEAYKTMKDALDAQQKAKAS
jgi:hypothetical protein